MDLTGIGGVAEFAGKLLDRLSPDPTVKAAQQLELAKMTQTGELAQLASSTELSKAQIAVNQTEAASSSLFVAGWRPAIGWVCAAGLAYEFLLAPLLPWALGLALGRVLPDLPDLPTETLMTLLFGMLGLGSLRTVEKIKGKA